jgi:diguanylate cyclase (GGDEF)-like protein
MDQRSQDVYWKFHRRFQDEPLHSFWLRMSNEEWEHVKFWQRAEQIEKLTDLPNLFEDVGLVIEELEHAEERTKELLHVLDTEYTLADAFLIAYRMEFYLLHSAFNVLFQVFGPADGEHNPADEYEAHIVGFIDMLSSMGKVTPELELLGETLQRLWKENRKLTQSATYDFLTGLLNRRGFFAVATQLASLAQRNRCSVGLLMLDIDHFKTVNDRHGHKTGDLVLKETARIIKDCLRNSDVVCRYGGEEFVVLLPVTSPLMTAEVAERIRSAVEHSSIDGISLTISIGIAEGTIDKVPPDELQEFIKQADEALYLAKEAGRNRVVKYRKPRSSNADGRQHAYPVFPGA